MTFAGGWYAFCIVFHIIYMRWIFFTTSLWIPPESLAGWGSETSREKSISHGKPYKMHFLTYFTCQGTIIKPNTLCKVADHENHVRWIYLTKLMFSTWGKVRSMWEDVISWHQFGRSHKIKKRQWYDTLRKQS